METNKTFFIATIFCFGSFEDVCTLKRNLVARVDIKLISASAASAVFMTRCTPNPGATTQGNSTMTNTLALAASMVMLMTISGQAFAQTAARSDQQAVYAATAFDHTVATDTDAATAHHYHGGPKYND